MQMIAALPLALGLLQATPQEPTPTKAPIKIFVLAGQSNMEGKAKVSLLRYQATESKLAPRFAHLVDGDGWVERDDVAIRFLDRQGPLTVGYGSTGCIGPELEFGRVVGDHFEEPVLLVKAAWGGRSLYRDFRPPSAGLPGKEVLDALLAKAREKRPEATAKEIEASFGRDYQNLLSEVTAARTRLIELVPDAATRGSEIAGLVWFQGWNDMLDDAATLEYADNLAHFIEDVRRDLGTPDLPVVIGQFGVGGTETTVERHLRFKSAQASVAAREEFEGNVSLVATDVFWDKDAEAVFQRGWRENLEEWNKVGSDYPFHYLGSVKTMCNIGESFGTAMLKLRKAAAKRAAEASGR
ncbi:MAG: sialate O-acetylesterase [Planctomycetota bacterium]